MRTLSTTSLSTRLHDNKLSILLRKLVGRMLLGG
jgi:hypothetical protein